jgi:hypothetical protein
LKFSESDLLVRIAGENLAESVPESIGDRSEQFALGLQKFAPTRQFVCESKVKLQQDLAKTLGKSRPIIQNFQGIAFYGQM